MKHGDRKDVLRQQLYRLIGSQRLRHMADRDLLEQFARRGDEAAFRVLTERYGPLVLRVCRRVLGNEHDAEDAFQATFLVLASKAGAGGWRESVANWLHGVAVRVARRARRAIDRRRAHEGRAPERPAIDPSTELSVRQAQGLLEEELARLPEKYRTPLVQCYLMERGKAEVARELGWPVSTLKQRLEHGQALLRRRLAARGLTLSVALLGLLLAGGKSQAVSPALTTAAVKLAVLFTSGQAPVAGSAAATMLAGAMIRGTLAGRLRAGVLSIVAVLALAGGGGAWLALDRIAEPGKQAAAAPAGRPTPGEDRSPGAGPKLDDERPAALGTATAVLSGKVLDAAGKPLPHAHVTALARRPFMPGEQGLRDDVLARGEADEHGAFRLRVPADFRTWLPHRQVALLVSTPGRAPATTIVPLPERGRAEVDLRLDIGDQLVRGRLVTPDGTGAAGVRLRVIRLGEVAHEIVQGAAEEDGPVSGWPGPVVADAEGRFELAGIDPVQGVWLQVDDERYAPDAFWLGNAEPARLVQLQPAQVIEGRVVAADSGLPLAGVKLTAQVAGAIPSHAQFAVADYQGLSARLLPFGLIDGVAGADGGFRLRPPAGPKTVVEVHPPTDSPYLAVQTEMAWPKGQGRQALPVALPRGVVVHGQVVDDEGEPVAGASLMFDSPGPGNAEHRPGVIQGRYRVVLSGKDGRFSITTPAGPVRLLAYGPTHDYRAQALRTWTLLAQTIDQDLYGWCEPLPSERRFYTHAEQALQLQPGKDRSEVRIRLTRGQAAVGRVVGPDGQALNTAVLLCGEKVPALRNGAVLPLPVRGGRYELPGCERGKVYPVLFLDAKNGCGAAVDLTVGSGEGPEVRLAPCGSARVRLVDGNGRPQAGRHIGLALLTERSFPADKPPPKREADGHEYFWIDPLHYADSPLSDADAWVTLPALIPGARYTLLYADPEGVLRQSSEFRVEPGQALQLPELAIRPR